VEDETAEHGRLTARGRHLQEALASAEEAVAAARRTHAVESEDVARLESFSPTRIWSALRGERDNDLNRERAERQAAEYAVARAESAADDVRRELADTEADLRRLGDPWADREAVHREVETWLAAQPGSGAQELATLVTRSAELTAGRREVDEALTQASRAAIALREALGKLGSAQSWATYDTFFGGGLITDAIKYDRVDEAERMMRGADGALRSLSRELADVGMTGVGGVEITDLTRTFDVWFDNIFSDWSVRDRIGNASDRLRQADQAVHGVFQRLEAKRQQLAAEQAEVDGRRRETVQAFLAGS